eukprot:m.237358 g.237358  ORF g.237358 m.237358 type:complete len:181 (-) comp21085_c0_seq1:23-565(-)
MAGLISISTRLLAKSDYPAVIRIVNQAFMVDAFFKKPEFHNRLDAVGSQLDELLAQPGHTVLVAHETQGEQSVVGCIHVHWYKEGEHPHGAFGMLSVSSDREKAGIGKQLVRAAEEKIRSELAGIQNTYIEIPVINLRPELIPWYERQGYNKTGEVLPFEAPHILADGYDIRFVMMRKSI